MTQTLHAVAMSHALMGQDYGMLARQMGITYVGSAAIDKNKRLEAKLRVNRWEVMIYYKVFLKKTGVIHIASTETYALCGAWSNDWIRAYQAERATCKKCITTVLAEAKKY